MKSSLRERLNISRYAIKYAKITLFFWIAVAVAGFFAFSSLKYALFPDVTFPVVIVNAQAPFETVSETEAQLTNPLEDVLIPINPLDLNSSTFAGQTVISVAFHAGLDLQETAEKVEATIKTADIPENATIKVNPFNLNESNAITYAISSETYSLEELREIAKTKIISPIEEISGVLRVNLLGDAQYRTVEDNTANPPSLTQFNGQDVLAFQVVKQANANTLEIVQQVETTVKQLQTDLTDVQLTLAETQADYIKEATQSTIEALIGAIILAILVIYPFLRDFKATFIAALAIPLSLLGTFIVMAIAGLNLETLTLLALALVIGIIVDDAIVDVENISRHIEKGETPRQAAIKGTEEIGLTVSVSTLTIVVVFLPIAFMGRTLGQFFKPFGLTVSAAVLISLLVARTLSPVLAAYWLKATRNQSDTANNPSLVAHSYRNLLAWSLSHRKQVIAIAIVSFIAGISLIPLIPQGFIPQLDRGEFNIIYTTPLPKLSSRLNPEQPTPDTPPPTEGAFSWISELAQSPERLILRKTRRVGEELGQSVLEQPDVASVFMIAGARGNFTQGKLYVKLKRDRTLTTHEVQEQVRENLPQIAGVQTSVEDIRFVQTGDDAPLQVALLGENLETLDKTAQDLKNELKALPGFVDVMVTGDDTDAAVIRHYDGQRAVFLSANLKEDQALGDATQKVVAIADSLLPADVTLALQGDSARVGLVFGDFAVTLGLAVVFMLITIYIPFRRWLEPMVIGLSLPLSIIGAMLALLITQSDFGMISLIGLIFLLGLLDKNAILLMDYINQLRQQGMTRHEAILETGKVRLRPILMTTFSTILGMMPLALGLGAGAELRQPMAVAIIGGLFTSSLLSLIVVPVLYTILEDSQNRFSQKKAE